MNKVSLKKDVVDAVCIVLEKEKNRDSIVFSSARGILRKTKREDFTAKDIAVALDCLEEQDKIKILSRSNRQTVIEVKDNLFELDLSQLNFEEEKESEKEIKLTITPKKLFKLFKDKSNCDKLEISCKEVRQIFNCSFSQVMATLKLLSKSNKISYEFDKGILYINFETSTETEDSLVSKDISSEHDVFDFIGESLESIFRELDRLKAENADLNKKLVIADVNNKRLKEEVTMFSARCDSLKDINNRLYNQIVSMKNNM